MIDLKLLFTTVKDHLWGFLGLLLFGCLFSSVGGAIAWYADSWLIRIFFGVVFGGVGLFLIPASFVVNWSSIQYYYRQGLLKQHGVRVDAVLVDKSADCQVVRDYDSRTRDMTNESKVCDLWIEFEYQFEGQHFAQSAFVRQASVFDRLQLGDVVPLLVLQPRPSVCKVRERRLDNLLKGRVPESPSQIPEGAVIGQ